MVYSQHLTINISVVRIIFEFYPIRGGSITHTIDLSKKINNYLKNQIIIAPDYGYDCRKFDDVFEVPVIRIKYSQLLNHFKHFKFPVLPLILCEYSYNVLKYIKKMNYNENTLLYVHGTVLGGIFVVLNRIVNLNILLIVLQDSGNIFNVSKKERLLAYFSYNLLRIFNPQKLIIVDDGMGVDETKRLCIKYSIPCEIVNHSIDTDLFKPENVRHGQKFTILSNHSLNHFKRVDLTILIFKRFLERIGYRNDVQLSILGSGPESERLLELTKIEELESYVKFLGEKSTKEVIDCINISDVVVGTSLKSNLNLSIQEAMACKKAVVVFDSGETKKLIKDMINGILIPIDDLEKFSEKLQYLYENQEFAKILGENARKTIIEERSWEIRIKKELSMYEEIFSRNGK
jgi:L-malate glycosyltransferase